MIAPTVLEQRSRLLQAIRSFFLSRQYIEVDTPIRQPILIPEAHIRPFSSDGWFLQTSPELCMKRLLASGCSRIFQICHCFRRGEQGRLHQPEFTMLEWYRTGWTYMELMEECEALVRWVLSRADLHPPARGAHGQSRCDIHGPWIRMRVAEAFDRYAHISVGEAVAGNQFEEILVTRIEPHLGRHAPVFLYDYPVEHGSLARRKVDNPAIAERFELYIQGIELANGFSELVDPVEQEQRFIEEAALVDCDDSQIPFKLLDALHELDSAAGIALGIDRMLMILLGADSIQEVVPFSPEDL